MILITGASGFLGAQLTQRLSGSGIPIRALYHGREPDAQLRSWPDVNWQRADLLDIYAADEAMQGIDEVYHCAAIVSFDSARKAEIIHTNTEIACNVVDAALDAGVRKLVHISSVAALGRNGSGKPITEEAQWEESSHNSAYGLSKYGAEMEVWRGIGEGLEAAILNPGIILGAPLMRESWSEGSAKLMHTAYKEFPFFTDGITAFVDVEDVATAATGLMKSPVSGERFILSAGDIPFRDVFTLMAKALDKKPPRMHAGRLLTSLVWRASALRAAFSGRPATITRETARNAQSQSFYKADKILTALPDFQYTPVEITINRMAQAFSTAIGIIISAHFHKTFVSLQYRIGARHLALPFPRSFPALVFSATSFLDISPAPAYTRPLLFPKSFTPLRYASLAGFYRLHFNTCLTTSIS